MSGQSITERWEYLTDIITSYDGHEKRLKIRQYPRHFLSYEYPAINWMQAQWLRGLGRLRQSDTYYIPMWHTPVYLREDHIAGKALYIQSECMMSLDQAEYIEIFVKDDVNQIGINIVSKVQLYLDGIIAVTRPINRPLDRRNTWIFPLKKCAIKPMSGLNYIYSNGTIITHSFEDLLQRPVAVHIPQKYLTDYEDYPQRNRWNLPETIDDKQVLTISPQWIDDSSVTLSVEKLANKVDNETGIFLYDLKNSKSYDIHTLELSLLYKESISNMIRFFKRVQGRYKSFYAPTWVNDIEIYNDLVSSNNFVYTEWAKISDFYLSNNRSKKLVIFTKDWQSFIFDIMTYTYEDVDEETRYGKIIFTTNIGFNLRKERILMASYLNLVRFDSDELQLNYESNTVANTTLVMKEVDDE